MFRFKWCGMILLVIGMIPDCLGQLSAQDTLAWGYKFTLNGGLLTGNVERLLVISGMEVKHTTDKIGWISTNLYQ